MNMKESKENMKESKELLRKWRDSNGMRKDWHEPDNQGVSAEVLGSHLDNAMGSISEDGHLEAWTRKADTEGYGEFLVVLQNEEGDKLEVNLAWLLAMASE